jgi:hypothetical protein
MPSVACHKSTAAAWSLSSKDRISIRVVVVFGDMAKIP